MVKNTKLIIFLSRLGIQWVRIVPEISFLETDTMSMT